MMIASLFVKKLRRSKLIVKRNIGFRKSVVYDNCNKPVAIDAQNSNYRMLFISS